MKVFILKSLLFAGIIIATMALTITIGPYRKNNTDDDFMASIIDKHARLDKIDSNRLILVGGSNIAFGINSERLQKELNKNVINLGMHGGLGLTFIMEEIKSNIKPGDVVLLNLEYQLFFPNNINDIELISFTQSKYPPSKSYYRYSPDEYVTLFYKEFSKNITNPTKADDPIYCRKCFNEYGDVISHLNTSSNHIPGSRERMRDLTTEQFAIKLKELYDVCTPVGAKIFIAFPPFIRTEYNVNEKPIKALEADLRKDITYVPIINTPETFVFDNSYFFDSAYHLNKEGREKRTTLLIGLLKKYMGD